MQKNFQPDTDKLILRSIQAANAKMYDLLRAIGEYGGGSYNDKIVTKVIDHYKEKQQKLDDLTHPLGFIKPEHELMVEKETEKYLTRLHHRYLQNKLARDGYLESVRLFDNTNDSPEAYNRLSNIAGYYLRNWSLLFLPIAPGHINSHHAIIELDLIEFARPYLREFLAVLIPMELRRRELKNLIGRYIYTIMRTVATSFYAGMRSGVGSLPLHGEIFTRKKLDEIYDEFVARTEVTRKISSRVRTVSQELDSEFDGDLFGTDWLQFFRSRLNDWEGLEQSGMDQKRIRQLQELDLSNHISSSYATILGRERQRRASSNGNLLDRTLPKLAGIASNVSLRELLDHPERYAVFDSDWIIAAEVSYYAEDTHGRADYVVLKRVETESGIFTVLVMIIDRKSITYEQFNAMAEVSLKRWQQLDEQELEALKAEPVAEMTRLKLLAKQLPADKKILDRIMHLSLDEAFPLQQRYLAQLEKYVQGMELACENHTVGEFDPPPPIAAILHTDLYYQSGKDLEELVFQEISLIFSFLEELTYGEFKFDNFTRKLEVQSADLPNVSLTTKKWGITENINQFTDILSASNIVKPFRIHPFDATIEQRKIDLALYYPVPGVHHSNFHVSLISSMHHLLYEVRDLREEGSFSPGRSNHKNVLLLDVSGWLAEFPSQKLLGVEDKDPTLRSFLDEYVKIKSVFYPINQFLEITQTYEYVILVGLNLLRKFIVGDTVDLYRRSIIQDLVVHIGKKLFIIEQPVMHETHSPTYRMNTLLPFPLLDKEFDEFYLTQLTEIMFNLPRPPHSLRIDHPLRDEQRVIVSLQCDEKYRYSSGRLKWKKFIASKVTPFSCDRFVGESIRFNNPNHFQFLLDNPKEYDIFQETERVFELFPWLDQLADVTPATREKRKIALHPVDIKQQKCSERCFTNTETQPESAGEGDRSHQFPNIFEYNPDLQLPQRKYRAELLPGCFSTYRANLPPKVKRDIKTYSSKTPKWQYFDFSQVDPSAISEPRGMVFTKEIRYVRKVINHLVSPQTLKFFSKELGKIDFGGEELDLLETFKKNNAELVKLLQSIDLIAADPQTVSVKLYQTLTQNGSPRKQRQIRRLYFFQSEIFETTYMEVNRGNCFGGSYLLHWLVIMIQSVWNMIPQLEDWQVSRLYGVFETWLGVQLGLPIKENSKSMRVPAKIFELKIDRIFDQVLRMTLTLLHEVQQLLQIEQSKFDLQSVTTGRICWYEGIAVLTLQEGFNKLTQYFVTIPYFERFPLGKTLAFETEFGGFKDILRQPHRSDEIAIITIQGREYLLQLERGDVAYWKCLGSIKLDRMNQTLRINYSNFPQIPHSMYPFKLVEESSIPHDSGSIEVLIPHTRISLNLERDGDEMKDVTYHLELVHDIFANPLVIEIEDTEELLEYYRGDSEIDALPDKIVRLHPQRCEILIEEDRIPEMIDAGELYQGLQGLLRYTWSKNELMPIDAAMFYQMLIEEIDQVLLPSIGHDEDRDAEVFLDEITLVRENGNFNGARHYSCFYINTDDQVFIDLVAFNFGIQLRKGVNFLPPWDIQDILDKRYLFNAEGIKFEIDPVWEFDRETAMIIQEDTSMYWLARQFEYIPKGSSRVLFGSSNADRRFEFVEYSLTSKAFITSWKVKGTPKIFHLQISGRDECDLVEKLKDAVSDLGGAPVLIDTERVISWERVDEEILEDILEFIKNHREFSGRKCRKIIHQ